MVGSCNPVHATLGGHPHVRKACHTYCGATRQVQRVDPAGLCHRPVTVKSPIPLLRDWLLSHPTGRWVVLGSCVDVLCGIAAAVFEIGADVLSQYLLVGLTGTSVCADGHGGHARCRPSYTDRGVADGQ